MNKTQPFLHISFVSICFQSYLKASDIEFEASLNNLIISHEKYPRILSSFEDNINSKLVSIQFQQIPSPRYDEIKNHVQLHFNKFLFELKLEVFLSIIKFLDNFFKQWSTEFVTDKTTVNHSENIVDRTTMEIQADLQEFRVIISTVNNPMFDVHVYQQNEEKDLLHVSIILYSYPEYIKLTIDDPDCSININSAKANIILLYKHIDQLMVKFFSISLLNFTPMYIELY